LPTPHPAVANDAMAARAGSLLFVAVTVRSSAAS
jgi:hypothetical protein